MSRLAVCAVPELDFEAQVAPLLIKRCVECHRGEEPAGGLSLTSAEGLNAGGDSGAVIERANLPTSHLLERVQSGEMPPEKQGRSQQLPAAELSLLQRWVAAGTPWPADRRLDYVERTNEVRGGRDWWSLQPVKRPSIPQLKQGPQPANPIDAFVRSKLESAGITPAPRADRRTLIRRLYHDLIGLPPEEKEIRVFVHNESPRAWEELVDQLLQLPQYGERWGRYWLDLARYADTYGYERDQEIPFAWKYRDWVVAALNADLPYDQFVLHQLAGDEIPDRDEQSVIATGFLRLGTWNDEPNDQADYQYERLEDLVHTTSSTFFALTVKCARCHSHKFDAITQEDYYRMASAFWVGPITGEYALGAPSPSQLGFPDVLGWTDVRSAPLHVLKHGDRRQPMAEVVPASLSAVPELERAFVKPADGSKTSRRRLQLARWITNPRHPLTSRVFVNRLWKHHFGQAIVRTPNNFGFLADPPTHPQLLDWLASEFLARGSRTKEMHRLILTSETWRQASVHPEESVLQVRDSSNRLWWKAERQRLDAEVLRDSLLAVSGELDLSVGGPGFRPTISAAALEGLSRKSAAWEASPPNEQRRRSLYVFLKRGLLPPMMTTFDMCDPTLSCGQRDVTVVPTQALALLNNQFVHARSEFLAETVRRRAPGETEQIKQIWTSVLQRQPSAWELKSSRDHLARQRTRFEELSDEDEAAKSSTLALASLCHVLMNSNEFLYVD